MFEQYQRKSKIQNFIERIRNPDPAEAKIEEESSKKRIDAKADPRVGVRSGSAQRSRATSAGKTRPTTSVVNVSNSQKTTNPPRDTGSSSRPSNRVQVNRNPNPRPPAAGPSESKRNHDCDEDDDLIISPSSFSRQLSIRGDEALPTPPLSSNNSRSRDQPPPYSHFPPPPQSRPADDNIYADDFEESDEPPPSYRNFVSSKEAKEGFPVTSSSSPRDGEGRLKGVQEEASSSTVPSYLNVIENKLQRKEKLSLIRQQTLDRVKQRQMIEEQKRRFDFTLSAHASHLTPLLTTCI